MEKSTNLFIRACKSENSIERLRKLFNRFYLAQEDTSRIDTELCHILGRVVDEYHPMSIVDYLSNLNKQESYYNIAQEVPPHKYYLTLLTLVSQIRYTNIDNFTGFVKPLKWRIRNEN